MGIVKSQDSNEKVEKLGETRSAQKYCYGHKRKKKRAKSKSQELAGKEKSHQI